MPDLFFVAQAAFLDTLGLNLRDSLAVAANSLRFDMPVRQKDLNRVDQNKPFPLQLVATGKFCACCDCGNVVGRILLTETRPCASLRPNSKKGKSLNPYEPSTSFSEDSSRPNDSIDQRHSLLYSYLMCFAIWGACFSSGVVLARGFNHFPAFPKAFIAPGFWIMLALGSFVYSVLVFCILGLIDFLRLRKGGATASFYVLFSVLAPAPWAFYWILTYFPLSVVARIYFMYAIPNLAYSAYRLRQNLFKNRKPAQTSVMN